MDIHHHGDAGRPRRSVVMLASRWGLAAALAAAPALASEEVGIPNIDGPLDIVRSQTNDHPLLVMPSTGDAAGALQVDGVTLSMEVADGFRIYKATTAAGRTRTAHVAVDGPPAHLAFNPKRHRFERLAPSLRVELDDYDTLPEVVEAAGGTGGKVYPLLGFALVRLPSEVNPATALASIESRSGVVSARLTVRGIRREPR